MVEQWFENTLKSLLKVDFMGDAAWFLDKDTIGILTPQTDMFHVISHNKQ